jgi:PAS domain S-box-containing protein
LDIQAQEALRECDAHFRELAEHINEVFWIAEPELRRVLYVSPAYESVWGRSCASLYAAPRSWLEAIHPEDRQRVAQAALTKLLDGHYCEEFRILRPDGSFRWVRDRGFPIHDTSGVVSRIVGLAEDITESKRLQQEILDIGERMQQRIARDLHDGLCQQLTGLALMSQALIQARHTLPIEVAETLNQVAGLLAQAAGEARHLAHGLAPAELADGLIPALRKLADSTEGMTGMSCEVLVEFPSLRLDRAVTVQLYRIAQEALHNAIKHARSQYVVLRLAASTNALVLTISDDGVGLPAHFETGEGIGVRTMRHRAAVIGASVEFRQPATGGTTVVCALPMVVETAR